MEYPVPRKENPIYLFWKILWAFCFSTAMIAAMVAFFSLNTGFTGMTPPAAYLVVMVASMVFFPIYTLPSYFAFRKAMKKRKTFLLVNLLLGWTILGYIACIVWVDRTKIGG